jgi:hypothetical protein
MWISILTSAQRKGNDGVLRIFGVQSSPKGIVKKAVTEYQIVGLHDLDTFDRYFEEYIGLYFECEARDTGVFCAMPDLDGEHEFKCSDIKEIEAAPNETDWSTMLTVAMTYYENESDELSHYHRWTSRLDTELNQEIDREERKVSFFKTSNPERWANVTGQIEALQDTLARLKRLRNGD